MAKTNPGLTLKYLSIVFCILALLFASLYKRFDTFLLGAGVALLAYGYKLDMTVVIFVSSLAVFLGSYLPFGRTSVSVIQGFSEGFASSIDEAEAAKIVLNATDNEDLKEYLADKKDAGRSEIELIADREEWTYARKLEKLQKQRADEIEEQINIKKAQEEYIRSEDTRVPDFCNDSEGKAMGRESTDRLLRLYEPEECLKISNAAVNGGMSSFPSSIQDDGQCLWVRPDEEGGVKLTQGKGPSYDCARLNFPDAPPKLLDLGNAVKLNIVNKDFDPRTEDQGSYYDKYNRWHKGPELKLPVDDDIKPANSVEGFENQNPVPKKKHLPPPDNADRKEMFELGKKYELPKETDDPEYHLDAGTTFLNAYKSLKPDQLSAMSKDTLDLINTQKQLMSTLNTLKPLISDGKQMMDTFQNYFGGGSGGNMGDLAKMAEQFAPTK
jgi:hypothetical protein